MKSAAVKLLALMLAACMVVAITACGTTKDSGTDKDETKNVNTEVSTDAAFPDVAKTNYGDTFTVTYCSDTFRNGYFFADIEDREHWNDLDDRLYERVQLVQEYLGVTIEYEDGGIYTEYANNVKRCCSSGDNTYQLIMTHPYYEVATMVSSNYFLDFNELKSINLDAEYWNKSLMEDLAINDAMYCGYNDFCLSSCYLLGFNKDIANKYLSSTPDADLYSLVRNKQWTLDKMMEIASLVSEDNGDGTWDHKDTYGFSGLLWVPIISFMTSSDMKMIERDESNALYVAPMVNNAERLGTLLEKMVTFHKSNSTYMWFHDVPEEQRLHLPDNRVLMEMISNYDLIKYKEEAVKIGVLPYPLYDTQQSNYKTLNWNGILGIPSTNAKNTDMVSDVMEMLAYYTAPVKTSFYETLLGAKVADAPEDVEMLNIIWSSQVSDLGLVFSSVTPNMDTILYSLPSLINQGTTSPAALYKANTRTVERAFERMFQKMS